MCDPSSKPGDYDTARSAHEALLALYDALAKYNASIRGKYPPSATLARVMEQNTSGWANAQKMPFTRNGPKTIPWGTV